MKKYDCYVLVCYYEALEQLEFYPYFSPGFATKDEYSSLGRWLVKLKNNDEEEVEYLKFPNL